MCEVSLVVWDFWPAYQLTGKGVGGGKGVQFFTLDTELLFRMLPNQIHSINRDGFRDEVPTKTGSQLTIVAGDSFPMGLAVEPRETFPSVLEGIRSGEEVYNLGVQGYGPDQELVTFTRYGLPLRPKRLILSLYPSNDFGDLLHNELVTVDPSGQSLMKNHPNPIESVLPRTRLQMFAHLLLHKRFLPREKEERLNEILFEDLPMADLEREKERARATQLMRLVLRDFRRVSMENKIDLLAVVIPSFDSIEGARRNEPRSHLDELAVVLCREEGIDVIDIDPFFRSWSGAPLYLPEDRHLSVTGHRVVAEQLAARLGGK
jgi:hypothetical protein